MNAEDSVRITAKHRSPDGQGNAYDLIRRYTGIVWVKPGRRHAAPEESFTGQLQAVA
jgi:hypothetical protein